MKQILVTCFLLAVINADAYSEISFRPKLRIPFITSLSDPPSYLPPDHPPPEYPPPGHPPGYFPPGHSPGHFPPGHMHHPPGHMHHPPGHMHHPPGHMHHPPGHMHYPPGYEQLPPDYQKSSSCPLLSFNVDQQNNAREGCTAALICRDPETGDMVFTKIDDIQSIINEKSHQDNVPNKNKVQDNVSSNNENGKNNVNINKEASGTTPSVHTPTPYGTNQDPGGEGLIDIRFGAN